MADDILLTQEELDERAKKWLKENGMALAVGISLGLGAVFSYNQYKANQIADAEQASELYNLVVERFTDSELATLDLEIDKLKQEHADTSYAAKAVLLKAKQLSVSDLGAAAEQLKWVAENAPEAGLRHTASIRLAKVKLAMGELDAAVEVASQTPYEGFDSFYHEILADIAVQKGAADLAREHYQKAIDSLAAGDNGYRAILTLKMNKLPELANKSEALAVVQAPAVVKAPAVVQAPAADTAPAADEAPAANQ